ncbi:hypothetical protein PSAB_04825 [Paenibacillus sabinae T27]|uniref:Uncharacterized protein n=1 Tax=Paenibacillus sabinae T27 TaxID=1268072 RepID=X4Z878_9BACL|nr:hypothetical protein PSAB_04825 [Paenibacillus sabinae T27]
MECMFGLILSTKKEHIHPKVNRSYSSTRYNLHIAMIYFIIPNYTESFLFLLPGRADLKKKTRPYNKTRIGRRLLPQSARMLTCYNQYSSMKETQLHVWR